MALTVTKKKDPEINEEDTLPQDDDVIEPTKIDRERELELELAEKKGELKALQKTATPANNQQLSMEQTKQIVYQDINNMSDEDFKKKYNQSKHAASMTVMDADNRQTKAEARRDRAEASASVSLSAKYPDLGQYMDTIQESMGDLSEEARQDPDRLKKFIEKQYLALSKESDAAPLKRDSSRRKIASDFEKPTVVSSTPKGNSDDAPDDIEDIIPEGADISNQKLSHLMGIRSEKERKQYADKNLIYVDMELGDGYHFSDPKRGFEKRVRQVA